MTATGSAETAPARDPAPALWLLTGACWLALVALLLTAGVNLASHDDVIEHSTLWLPLRLLAFCGAWLVMIGAMMVPGAVPAVRSFWTASAAAPRPAPARTAFAASYLVIWLGFALAALAGDTTVHWAVAHSAWLHHREPLVLAATLGLAGVYQLTPWKHTSLLACRSSHASAVPADPGGARAGWGAGFAHAGHCLGCCWALMLVMFATGVGSLVWMLGLTSVMVLEKVTPDGARLRRPVALGFLAAGAALALPVLLG